MKKKKLLSVILASALAVSMMPFQAFAAPTDAGSSQTAGGTIGGNSSVASNAVLKFKVPMDFDFTINPLELPVTGSADPVAQIISTPYTFQNMSNMDVQLSVKPVFTSSTGVTIASSPDEIKNIPGEPPTIFMQVAPTTAKPTLTGSAGDLSFDTTSTPTFASGTGISMTISGTSETANTAYFKLKSLKTAYATDGTNMTYDSNQNTVADTDAVGFKFIGKVSQMSNWKADNLDLGVTVEYKFDFISGENFADPDNVVTGTYQMVKENLAKTGPAFNLTSNGEMSITDLPDGYTTSNLYYFYSSDPITTTVADIEAALASGPIESGTMINGLATGVMNHPGDFSWNPDTLSGNLVPRALSDLDGYNFVAFTIATKADSSNIVVLSSNVVIGS